jgi:alkanesulfonate monooxygenase SsuD/methylene tetrahydromethanopterin reductase-like flavin-dependent oxidoreductase (luciferase family)
LQQPHPPFWYASSSAVGATWAGARGLHFVTLGPTRSAKASIDAYREALAKRGAPAQPKPEFAGGAVIGLSRYIFVAESDEDARRIAEPAMQAHVAHVKWLATRHGDTGLTSRLNLSFGASYEDAVADGTVIAGTPEQVLIEIERQAGMLGINYLLSYLFLGNMTLADALRSLDLFSTEVMPHLANL